MGTWLAHSRQKKKETLTMLEVFEVKRPVGSSPIGNAACSKEDVLGLVSFDIDDGTF